MFVILLVRFQKRMVMYKGWFVTKGFIPKLTEEDKGYLYLSLLDDGQAVSAGSDQIRSLYSAVKAYNLVYIIIQ